jgi:hypothetical protein
MMTDPLDAVLINMGTLFTDVGELKSGYRDLEDRSGKTTRILETIKGNLDGIRDTLDNHGEVLAQVPELVSAVTELSALLPQHLPDDVYEPLDTVRWWTFGPDDEERTEALDRIRDWVNDIWLKQYGYLSASLGECWQEHPLVLTELDWLSELWSFLYISSPRTSRDLSAQAEFNVRIVPQVAEILAKETGTCTNHGGRS